MASAVGLVRSEASSQRLKQAGGTPVRGTVLDLDVLAKAAASGRCSGLAHIQHSTPHLIALHVMAEGIVHLLNSPALFARG